MHTPLLRAAQRRLRMIRAHRGAASGLAAGLLLAGLLLILDRAIPLALPLHLLLLPVGAGVLAGAIIQGLRPVSLVEVASRLDRHYNLSDCLATAQTLTSRPSDHIDPMFRMMVIRDAEQRARGLRSAPALPLSVQTSDAALLAGLLLFAGCAIWLPSRSLTPPSPAMPAAAYTESDDRAAETVRQTIEQLRSARAHEDDRPSDATSDEALALLETLAEQLSRTPDPNDPDAHDRARQSAAAAMSDVADRMSDEAAVEAEAARRLQEAFRGLDDRDLPPPIRDLRSLLETGRFDDAAALLEQLIERAGEPDARSEGDRDDLDRDEEDMNPEELAAALDALREHLASSTDRREADLRAQRERVKEALRQHGATEREIRELLGDDGDPSPDDPASSDAPDELSERPGDDRDPNGDDASDGDRDDQSQRPEGGDASSRESLIDRLDDRLRDAVARQKREEAVQERAREHTRDVSEALRETSECLCEGGGSGAGAQDDQSGEDGAGGDEANGGEATGDQQQPGASSGGMQRMAERMRQAERNRELAEEARQAARRLIDSDRSDDGSGAQEQPSTAPPAQPQTDQPGDSGSAGSRDPGAAPMDPAQRARRERMEPESFEDVDLNPDAEAERLLAEWLDPDRATEIGDARPSSGTGSARIIERGRRSAERAVEESHVPSRYHDLIRRYFGRMNEPAPASPARPEQTP